MKRDAAGQSPSDAEIADEGDESDVPTPTLLMGMLTAVAAGGFVGWALLPLSTPVAGLPLYAVAAVATTLWAGIAFLRRKLPTGVLAEGFYLMGVAVLARPVSVALALDGLPEFLADPGAVFMTFIVAAVVASLLLVAGWRLDTHARKTRVRKMRRRVTRRMSRKQAQKGPMPSGMTDSDGTSARSQGSNGNGSVRTEQEP